jgi:hypothetical protein
MAWDNPVIAWTPPATLVVRLSRGQAGDTHPISDRELEKRPEFNPQKAFRWIDNAGNDTWRYLATFNDPESVTAVGHPLLPEHPTDAWGRFNHSPATNVDPSRTGTLVLFEWGLTSPKLLSAAWIPRSPVPASAFDVVVFFSPPTGPSIGFPADSFPWGGKYPYVATRPSWSNRLVQPYPALSYRYLFRGKWLVDQLFQAGRQAIVLFPIQPSTDWGPFATGPGLARLLAELMHFIHRTSMGYGDTPSRDQDKAPRAAYRFGRLGLQRPIPTVRRLVLAGFSAGVTPIASIMGTALGARLADHRFPEALWAADVAPFLGAWQEAWNHDAPAPVRAQLDQVAPAWLRSDPRRIFRGYQTTYTGTPRSWLDASPLAAFARGPITDRSASGSVAAERHDAGRCSLVWFGDGYLKHASAAPPAQPAFWLADNDHQAVPMVTFGHAATTSGLAKR